MNWEAIGAISEIVGAIAVVVTLAYLAIQVRDSTRIAKSAARQAIAEMSIHMGMDLVADKELTAVVLKDFKEEDVDEADRVRLFARNYIALRHYENIYYQFQSGMLENDEWAGFRRNLKAMLKWRSTREFWKNEHAYYSDAFRAEVKTIEAEIADDPSFEHGYVIDKEPSG